MPGGSPTLGRPYLERKKSAAFGISRTHRQPALQGISQMIGHRHARAAKMIEPDSKVLACGTAQVVKYRLSLFAGTGAGNHYLKGIAPALPCQSFDQGVGMRDRHALGRDHDHNVPGREGQR